MMKGICMGDVTHYLYRDNILPINIFKSYERHNVLKEHKQVISNKTHWYINEIIGDTVRTIN